MEHGRALGAPPLRVAVAVEVDGSQAGVPVGQLVGHVQHAVVDVEGSGVGDDAVGDLDRQRAHDERHQHHHLHDAHPVGLVAAGQRGSQLLGADRTVVGDVDGVAGHRLEHRGHEQDLQRRRPGARADRRQHGVAELLDLRGVRRAEVDVAIGGNVTLPMLRAQRFRPDPGCRCDRIRTKTSHGQSFSSGGSAYGW